MMLDTLRRLLAILALAASGAVAAQMPAPLAQGSIIPPEDFVSDSQGSIASLRALLESQPGKVNVVFIFGGGDKGSKMPGRLWCQDSPPR